MKRREALSSIAAITGSVVILPQLFLSGCAREAYPYTLFEWGDLELLNDIVDIIIPDTPDSPGAKAANVGDFVQLHVTDCYKETDQNIFLEGFKKFKVDIQSQFNQDFIKLSFEEKVKVLKKLDLESAAYKKKRIQGKPKDFYALLKHTTMFGYFTSEIGATKALRYLPVPGYQKGEVPYHGEKAWAL